MRCRYTDCAERHPVAAEDELVTCPTCRKDLGLAPLAEPAQSTQGLHRASAYVTPGWTAKRMRDLRVRLAATYRTTRSQQRACDDCGLDTAFINFHGAPQDVWFEILRVADRMGALDTFEALPDNEPFETRCPHCNGILSNE